VDGLASGIEVLRWYGFGNATRVDGDRPMAYYRVTQHQIALAPSLGWALGRRSLLSFGPRFRYSVTGLDDGHNAERFIGLDRPFGAGHFSQLGFAAQLEVDTRDVPAAARRGVHLVVAAAAHPALFDVTHAYGSVSAEGATYLTARLPGTPTLALKAGGQRIWGTAGAIPYFDAAVLGSASTLRGYRTGRFAGDEGAVWGSAELRLHLTSLFIAVPGQQGVFGFYDGGRVFHRGDGPGADEWHHSVGGGLWLSFLTRGSLVSLAVGRSDEGNRFHARVGFAF
jgi:outer membrane protein assembly factor BamA